MDREQQQRRAGPGERTGHGPQLRRRFSPASMLGLAFAILNTWTALAASLPIVLRSGGSSAAVWGLVVAGVCNLCLAASLAEFLAAYPTAAGQYYWAAAVCWPRRSRAVSYATGWINVTGWVVLSATGGLLGSSLTLNAVVLLRPGYEPQPWRQFLVYAAFNLGALVVNARLARWLPYLTKAALLWSVTGLVVVSATVLACAAPDLRGAGFVYGGFVNHVGWPDGLAWLLGLLQGAFALTGFDATAHMIEEMAEPETQGPRVMVASVVVGTLTGFVFLSCLLFSVADDDLEHVVRAAAGPLLQILVDATGSAAAGVCLLVLPLGCVSLTSTMLMCTSSRMSHAFARDGGMGTALGGALGRVDALGVPLNALLWTAAWALVFGCVLLGSSNALSAITSALVVALGVTYAVPPAINVLRGRRMLPADRAFKLPAPLGWLANLVGIAWTLLLTTVLFMLPPETPVTPGNMNYCVVAFGIMLALASLTWILDGRHRYQGPKAQHG